MSDYDVIVIGAGAAGLIAAGMAAKNGARTLALEKMERPARKLRISGKGRCNLTNITELEDFIEHFGKNGRFLRQAFSRFFTDDVIDLFNEIGLDTVTERGGRIFPASNKAQDVVDALVRWNRNQGAEIRSREEVTGLCINDQQLCGVYTRKTDENSGKIPRLWQAKRAILATGGASYPATGSTGDGYRFAKQAGHTIVPIRPALVPLVTSGNIAGQLHGLNLRNVSLSLWISGKKKTVIFGELTFLQNGLSGPIILTISRQVVDALRNNNEVEISINLKPALDDKKLDARLLRDLQKHRNRQFLNVLKGLLPAQMIPVFLKLTGIAAERECHQITAQERASLHRLLRNFRLKITGYGTFSEAIITAGGVSLKEINPRTMASKLIDGLFIAGELLDLDADTGGYNLQAAFSTGWLAGKSVAENTLNSKDKAR